MPDILTDAPNKLAAVDRAAKDPAALTPTDVANATDWFLSDTEEEVAFGLVPVNVAGPGQKERIVNFKVQVVDRDKIRALRKESERTVNGEREVDDMEANLKILVEGLLEPNVKGDASMRVVRGERYMDPADALKARFAHKPGLIDQLAGKIVQISGYDEADVKEVKAAGN